MPKSIPSPNPGQDFAEENSASNQQHAAKSAKKTSEQLRNIWREESNEVFIPAFNQGRVAERAISVVEGILFSTGSGTIADAIRAQGKDHVDASADMRSIGRMISPNIAFRGIFYRIIPFLPNEGPVILAIDDTNLPKRGKKTAYTRWCHNPLVPPWQHDALMLAHPVFHAAVVVPDAVTKKPLAITVAFEPVEPLPKELRKKRSPKKRAGPAKPRRKEKGDLPSKGNIKAVTPQKKRGRPTKEEAARKKLEEQSLRARYPTAPDVAVKAIHRVRQWMDEMGLQDRVLIVVGDGSYTNATVFFSLPDRCVYVGRVRPDATVEPLGKPKPGGGFAYGQNPTKPEALAVDPSIQKIPTKFIYGGDLREGHYKVIGPVTRHHSTKKLLYRLLLLRPKVYYEGNKPQFTHEASLLTSDHTQPPELLIQAYLWRWAIECNHRDSKTNARIGKAHCRVAQTVTRVHSAIAAGFALLWLCVLKLNGGTARTEIFLPQSHWQKANLKSRNNKRKKEGKAEITPRASSVDVLNLFRDALHGLIKHGVARIAS